MSKLESIYKNQKIMLKSEKQDWSTIFKNIFVSSSKCFVALINYGLLENTALLRRFGAFIIYVENEKFLK